MSEYTYSLVTDFGSNLNTSQLNTELENDTTITTAFKHIQAIEDDVDIAFVSALSGAEITALDALVAAHSPTVVEVANYNYSKTVEEDPNIPTLGKFSEFTLRVTPSEDEDGSVHITKVWPYNISVSEMGYLSDSTHIHDQIELVTGENDDGTSTQVGILLAGCGTASAHSVQNYTAGALVTYTPSSVHGERVYECILDTVSSELPTDITYWKHGYKMSVNSTVLSVTDGSVSVGHVITLDDSSNTPDELGEVIEIDKINNIIYTEKAPSISYSTSDKVLAKYYIMHNHCIPGAMQRNIGKSKIGSSGLKKDVPVKLIYTTKTAETKSDFVGFGEFTR